MQKALLVLYRVNNNVVQNGGSKSAYWRVVILAVVLIPVGWGTCDLLGQENVGQASVLHIQHSVTTSRTDFTHLCSLRR